MTAAMPMLHPGLVQMLQVRVFAAVIGAILRRTCLCPTVATLPTRARLATAILGSALPGLSEIEEF